MSKRKPASKKIITDFLSAATAARTTADGSAAKAAQAEALQQQQEEAKRKKEKRADDRYKKKVFADYYTDIAPIITALESLPTKNGEEFIARVDLNPPREFLGKECGRSIDIWLFYTKEADPEKTPGHEMYHIHMPRKNGVNEYDTMDFALNDRPALRISLKPGLKEIITSHHFETSCHQSSGRSPGTYFYSNGAEYKEEVREYVHHMPATVKDLQTTLADWVGSVAPDRLDELRAQQGKPRECALQQDMPAPKPFKF